MSLGLIVTELVINALKHAFPDHRKGKIVVSYHCDGDAWTLSVADDGVGIRGRGFQKRRPRQQLGRGVGQPAGRARRGDKRQPGDLGLDHPLIGRPTVQLRFRLRFAVGTRAQSFERRRESNAGVKPPAEVAADTGAAWRVAGSRVTNQEIQSWIR